MTLLRIRNASSHGRLEVGQALAALLVEGEPRDQDVEIFDITAITHSKGEFVGNLPRLRHTVYPPTDEVAKLSPDEQIEILCEGVMREFGRHDERFRVTEEGWSGRLVASNTGAARRFSILRQLSWHGKTILPATVTTVGLDPAALAMLTDRMWVFMLPSKTYMHLWGGLERLRVDTPQQAAEIFSDAQDRDEDRELWTIAAVERSWKHYRDFRLGLEDAAVPLFDLSRWLRELASGRRKP